MDESLLRMKYAFALVFVKRIIEADGVIHPEEAKYCVQWFPNDVLIRLSLHTKENLLNSYVQSLEVLPDVLDATQKQELFGLLLGACLADDYLDFREFGILEAAARVLRIGNEEMFHLIDFFLDADIPSESDVLGED